MAPPSTKWPVFSLQRQLRLLSSWPSTSQVMSWESCCKIFTLPEFGVPFRRFSKVTGSRCLFNKLQVVISVISQFLQKIPQTSTKGTPLIYQSPYTLPSVATASPQIQVANLLERLLRQLRGSRIRVAVEAAAHALQHLPASIQAQVAVTSTCEFGRFKAWCIHIIYVHM